ncbi:TolC family protein [Sulfurovum sp.]|uniref:TolC family protein n=1 Tax=Sulfurovum sp. TaxID=1969726 RepID=UPI0025E1BA88|nr:TolC family protein [Sulfurovum sp.]
MRNNTLKIGLSLLLAGQLAHAVTITTLLDAVKQRPQSTLDALEVQRGALGERRISDKLMPKLDAFAGYEIYNRPSNLRPVLPSEMQTPGAALPFSKNISRLGVQFSWPVFVKSLYTLKEKASLMHLAAKDKKKLNLIQREAGVVGAVAYLRYMESLKGALLAKERSILATRKKVALMVKEGRAAQSQLLTLDTHINELKMNIVGIDQQRNSLFAKVETLTGISPRQSVPLRQKGRIKKEKIFALLPLEKKLRASQAGIKAAKENYYPTLAMKGSYTRSHGDAYNNDESVNTNYGMLGLYVNIPIYDSSKSTAVEEAKLDYYKERSLVDDTRDTLGVKARELSREIVLLGRSFKLAQKSVKEQKTLLKVAKVSLENEVITQEEYLRYEDALANAKANLYKIRAQKWQDIAQLAVIYGNDLRRIVK